MGTPFAKQYTSCSLPRLAMVFCWLLLGQSSGQVTPAERLALETEAKCKGVFVPFNPKTDALLRRLRAQHVGNYFPTAVEIDYLFSGGASSFRQSHPVAFWILLAAVVTFFLIAPIFGCVFWFNIHFSIKKRPFLYTAGVAMVLLIGAFGLLVGQIVIAVKVEYANERVRCQITRVGNLIVNGGSNPDSGNGYLGLTQMANVLTIFG